MTSVSEDAFSTTNSDLLDLDSPRSNETLDSNEDSFTLSQDMAPNHTGLDKEWRKSWPEDPEPSVFLTPDEGEDFNTLSQYFNQLLSRNQSKETSNKLDFSFSNDSDFLQFLSSSCASSKSDVSIMNTLSYLFYL